LQFSIYPSLNFMDDQLQDIMIRVRELALKHGIRDVSLAQISRQLDIPAGKMSKYFKDETDLVEKVLEFERDSFRTIFDEFNFEGVNAIDILLTVSKEIATRFTSLTPSISVELKKYYPEIYQRHFELRIEFIFGKIKINIEKGIRQGMYRDDLSIELIARLYISRLIDLHNPDFFPPDKFSFATLFEVMFENFIHGICNEDGIKYYKKQKRSMKFDLKQPGT
jgi:TetR/AcrR family transcriptional regulator, cholesterol catabolism regulator